MLSDKAMQVVVSAVAKAIHNSRKFNQAEQKQASNDIVAAIQKDTSLLAELQEMNEKISNVSQCSQDLAKAGVVSHGEPSAFARQVATAVKAIEAAQAKALDDAMKNPKKQ